MRRLITLAAALCAAIAGLTVPQAAQATIDPSYTGGNPVIFLTPHQDDETMTYGVSIHNLVAEGVPVLVYLLTDGSESGVCYQRYGTWGGTNQTRENGGLGPDKRARCTAQRDAEFNQAVTRLGATPVIWADRKQDGCSDPTIAAEMTRSPCTADNTLTHAAVRNLIDSLVQQYPDAAFKGMSYHEANHCDGCDNGTSGPGHPDHAAIGEGLLYAYRGGDIPSGDVRFYIKRTLWPYWPGEQATNTIGFWAPQTNIDYAMDSYGPSAPDGDGNGPSQAGDGIGMASVSSACEQYSTHRGYVDPSLNCTGFNYFGDAPGSPYGQVAASGADTYIHKPQDGWTAP